MVCAQAIFEMLCGYTPFGKWVKKQPPADMLVFKRLTTTAVAYPKNLDSAAKAICRGFLQKVPGRRLGCLKCAGDGIKNMPFFKTVDWDTVRFLAGCILHCCGQVARFMANVCRNEKFRPPPPICMFTNFLPINVFTLCK